ncbi:hypothetical protein TCDM_09093 [Trypanosoma cruzi Dm28c]|uniref:Uncharacterized protein n=2 Tax=Trypanosoma cruzi TaxID=5693 RepID=V5B6B2_TRYCR|nr:hypothetical protein TCDM_09093 [Trypanosoma cruzi Dm28c]PWU88942.1 hypothetical protein C4B63_65g51 [Trypanosoma cruzi]
MPFPTYEGDFPDDALRRPHFFYLTTRRNAGLVLSDEGLPSRLEPKRRVHEESCYSRLVDAWPGRSLIAAVEHLICLIAEPSTHCTVLPLLSSADKGGSHDGVLLLEGSVRRKNIIYSFFFLGETNPFFDSSTSALSQFLLAAGVFGVYFNQWLSLAAPRPNIDWCLLSWAHVAWPINCLCNCTKNFLWRGSCLQNMNPMAADRAGGCCFLYDSVLADFTLLRVSNVTSVPRRVAEA